MNAATRDVLDLLDWRRRVLDLYARVRAGWPDDPAGAHAVWRAGRDRLVGEHPQSPLDAAGRARFRGLAYHPYDPALVFTATLEPASEERLELPTSTGGTMAFVRCGRVRLPLGALDVYWLDAYGGGLFLPVRDATSGLSTYGGGRYLLDTAKGADLGSTGDGRLILDLNFAYNPSCSYRADWTCPLPPPGNHLDAPAAAGERTFDPDEPATRPL